jgi:hypothetical protein
VNNHIKLLILFSAVTSVISLNSADTATEAPTQKFLNYIGGLETFDPNFSELLTRQAKMVLTPEIEQSTLDTIVKKIENNKPKRAISHLDPFSRNCYDAS